MKRPRITEMAARVIAKRNAENMGPDWKHTTREEKVKDGDKEIAIHVPVVYHGSDRIGLHYVPDDGWVACIGLQSTITGGSALLLKAYSDMNRNPRLAALECVSRLRRMVSGLKGPFETIDQIDRQIQRLEWPKKDVPDVPTFEFWWQSVERPPGTNDATWEMSKDLALSAWNAKP